MWDDDNYQKQKYLEEMARRQAEAMRNKYIGLGSIGRAVGITQNEMYDPEPKKESPNPILLLLED